MGRRNKTGVPPTLVLADKPAGLGSAALVARLRKEMDGARTGHAGTLDRFATGLMVLLAGPATALADVLLHQDKDYLATFVFGRATDTHDPEGETIANQPDEVARNYIEENRTRIEAALAALLDIREQIPPAYSALKTAGRRYSDLARSGTAVLPPARPARVYELAVTAFEPEQLRVEARVSVSSGTYIRALARDLGAALDFPVHLGALRRVRIGAVSLENSSIWRPDSGDGAGPPLLDPRRALPEWPVLGLNQDDAGELRFGRKPRLDLDLPPEKDFFLEGPDGMLLAWARAGGGRSYSYRRVFSV